MLGLCSFSMLCIIALASQNNGRPKMITLLEKVRTVGVSIKPVYSPKIPVSLASISTPTEIPVKGRRKIT